MALFCERRKDHFIDTCLGFSNNGIHFLHVGLLDIIFLHLGRFEIVYHVFETPSAFVTCVVEFFRLAFNFLRVQLCKSSNLFFKEFDFILESIFNLFVFITSLPTTLLSLIEHLLILFLHIDNLLLFVTNYPLQLPIEFPGLLPLFEYLFLFNFQLIQS